MNGGMGAEFRPRLSGVVAKDLSLARQLAGVYRETLASVGTLMERSLACAPTDSEESALLERLSFSALEQLRLIGELTAALGGGRDAARHARRAESGLSLSAGETRRRIERYETLMGCTGDRVVRSVLTKLITAERRNLGEMERRN